MFYAFCYFGFSLQGRCEGGREFINIVTPEHETRRAVSVHAAKCWISRQPFAKGWRDASRGLGCLSANGRYLEGYHAFHSQK